MGTKTRSALLALTFVLVNALCAYAQLRPDNTTSPNQPNAPKPARIVIQTLPDAQVYPDDVFKGQASEEGWVVIENPESGEHKLRVSLPGKQDFQQSIILIAGKGMKIAAAQGEPPVAVVPRPRGAPGPIPGQLRHNPQDGLIYVWIPPGTFMMGCSPGDSECNDDEKPPHQVTVTKGFWVGHTEVPVGAYKRFVAATGRQMSPEPNFGGRLLNPGWGDDAMPMVDVTWDDAQAYCRWAGGRLPTEAEWEYAARAGSTTARYGDLDAISWYADNSGVQRLDSARSWREDQAHYMKRLNDNGNGMRDFGLKRANGYGLYDTLGNVWEWVNDWYDQNYYQNSPSRDPSGPVSGDLRVLRGGSWGNGPWAVRVSDRAAVNPAFGSNDSGFRCAREGDIP